MQIVSTVFQIIGSLGLLLFGMKMMSDGIQKSAGESLHKILNFMTGNRFLAVLTGLVITAIVQSSGATTVMVVSFVNAGLLTLTQAIGVIFGANIGTTVTAWIVALFGFNFKLTALAVPIFGIGFFLTFFKKLNKDGLGEALMGFALLFIGLGYLTETIPSVSYDQVRFISFFANKGVLGLFVGVFAGMIITMLLHSSSAATAILLTMAHNGILSWEFSAAVILGSNIGSTIDAVLAAIGTKVNARRAAAVHVLFNVTGTVLAMIFFKQFLALIEFIVPGELTPATITTRIATLHTVFNCINTLIFLPFINQIARLVEFLIKPGAHEPPPVYKLPFPSTGAIENAESYVFYAEKEIVAMSDMVRGMFETLRELLEYSENGDFEGQILDLANDETYADQMQEELSAYLVKTLQLPLSTRTAAHIRRMLRIVDDLESMTDDIYTIAMLIRRSREKKMTFKKEDIDRLKPYVEIVDKFLLFVHNNLNKPLSQEDLTIASSMEAQIDGFRKNLKKIARKRLEKGADVKAELLYIDIVRNIEHIGDHAFSISGALAEEK